MNHQIMGGDDELRKIIDQLLRKVHARIEDLFQLGSVIPPEMLLKEKGDAAQ